MHSNTPSQHNGDIDAAMQLQVEDLARRLLEARKNEGVGANMGSERVIDVLDLFLHAARSRDAKQRETCSLVLSQHNVVEELAQILLEDRGNVSDIALLVLDMWSQSSAACRRAVCRSSFLEEAVKRLKLPPTPSNRDSRLRILALLGDLSQQSENACLCVGTTHDMLPVLMNLIAATNELQTTRESALNALVHISASPALSGNMKLWSVRDFPGGNTSSAGGGSGAGGRAAQHWHMTGDEHSAGSLDTMLAGIITAPATSVIGTPRARIAAMNILCNLFRAGGGAAGVCDLRVSLDALRAILTDDSSATPMMVRDGEEDDDEEEQQQQQLKQQ